MVVLRREWSRMTSRRIYFAACIILPLFSMFFMATIFGSGQMNNLAIGVVDDDNTSTSREIVRIVESSPTLLVTKKYANRELALNDVRRKNIYGYLYIPSKFEKDIMGGNNTSLNYYYHYALMSVGSEIHGAFQTLIKNISVAPIFSTSSFLGIENKQIEAFLIPSKVKNYPLFNPDMDYSIYLTQPFFFVFIQILLLLVVTYSIGSEGKYHTADEWIKCANGNMIVALCAKLLPYTIIFIVMGILANFVFFAVMHIPMSCGFLPINLITVLFILSTIGVAVFIFSLFPALSVIISFVSMIGSLGATLGGVTFPVTSMYDIVHFFSYFLPIRHFVDISHTLLYGDYGFSFYWMNIVFLLFFILIPLLLLPRLKSLLTSGKYDDVE